MESRRYQIDPSERLDRCPTKGAALTWPIPLDEHLDRLRDQVEIVGERTTRRELVAAIVFAAPNDSNALAALLRAYRLATVAALGLAAAGENVIELASKKPGPRRHSEPAP